jgi:hypothetical protein
MSDATTTPEEQLRQEVAALPVDEILALCYTFKHKLERLRLYLDVLRRRGGERAQFASCLICFDLARQGEVSFQQEFVYLADTMRQLSSNTDLVGTLVSNDPYLGFLWEMCSAQLQEMDPRFQEAPPVQQVEEVATVDLLSDDDFEDFGIGIDDAEVWLRFDRAVETFLGGEVGVAAYDPEAGFRVKSSRDVERVEHFVLELESLRDLIPIARGFRALVLLFYGLHMRSKSIFGAVNQRKQALLRDGLREFLDSGPELWQVAGVLNTLHASDNVWDKISDLVLDYLQWVATSPEQARQGLAGYDPIARLLERQPSLGNRRREERD